MSHSVQFDYTATNSKELTIRKGDVLTVIDAPPKKQWWKASYLKARDKKPVALPVEASSSAASSAAPKPSHPMADYSSDVPKRVRAIYAYAAQRLDELTVKENDEILVMDEENDGWFRGVLVHNNASGWLPICFTTEISTSASSSQTSSKSAPSREPPKRQADTLAFNTALSTQNATANVVSCCTVVYDFDATQEGQLTLRKGDVLWILEKTNENWWQARNYRGLIGYVPVLYVKEEEEISPHPSSSAASTLSVAAPVNDIKKALWYHETFTREKSEQVLKETAVGTFLVRASTSHAGDYSLSVNIGGQSEHFKISFDVADTRYVFGIRRFDSIFALVDFYKDTNAVFTLANGTPIYLTFPYRFK